MLPRDRLPRQAKGFDAAGPLAKSHPHAPSRSHPLQARNPQQPQAEFEGDGAEAAEGQAGAAGGTPSVLGTGAWSLMLLGPQGGSATVGYTHALNSGPSEGVAGRGLCNAVSR